jgi:hypothetical protein
LAQAVTLRVSGHTEEEIAQNLGVQRVTVSRYLNSEEGQRLLSEVRQKFLVGAKNRLTPLLERAVEKLGDLLNCGSPAVEHRAAVDILRLAGLEQVAAIPAGTWDFTTAAGIKKSLEELGRLALAGDVPEATARAVASLAALAGRLLELETFEERLEKLEQALGGEKR